MANRKKNVSVSFRVTPEAADVIHQKATESGLTLSEYLTGCALGKEIVNLTELAAFTKELKAQGTNLNRLAVLANIGKVQALNVEQALDLYRQILAEVRKLNERRRR